MEETKNNMESPSKAFLISECTVCGQQFSPKLLGEKHCQAKEYQSHVEQMDDSCKYARKPNKPI